MRLNYLLSLLIITISCKSPTSNMLAIDPDPRKFIDNKITLSEIIDDIKYTPLDNSYPIGKSLRLRIIGGDIYLSIIEGVVLFDHNGKFVQKFGRHEASSSDIEPRSFKKAKLLIKNDFDGGMQFANDFKPYSINGEGYIAAFINPIDLKRYVSSSEFKNIVPKYPGKKEAFRKMAEAVNETDNPILVTAHLKNRL